MIALGNDVVDLHETPRNGDKYYYRLIQTAFTSDEMDQLPGNFTLKLACAVLWSAKEAAYKSLKKLGLVQDFNPKDIRVHSLGIHPTEIEGVVTYKEISLKLKISYNEDWVHSTTFFAERDRKWAVVRCDNNYRAQTLAARKAALEHYHLADKIDKTDGIPVLMADGKRLPNELSLSHHGQFAAFALES